MRYGIVAAACALALAGCASPAENAAMPTPEAVANKAADGRGEVRCIDAAMTGSRIRQRVCLSEADWERWQRDSQELLREWQGPKTQAR
jgi:hypothetical protein